MGPRVRAPENRGGGNASRAAPLFWGHAGIAWRTGGTYVGGKRSKKPGSAWRTRPRGGGNTSQGRQASPTCELLRVSGPDAIMASTETFTAHIFSRARVAPTSPSLRKPRARRPHSVTVPKRTFTPFGLLRLQNPQQRPPNGAWSNEPPSEPARIVDVERQKYVTPHSSCLTAAYSPASRAPRRRSGPPGRSSPSWRKWR